MQLYKLYSLLHCTCHTKLTHTFTTHSCSRRSPTHSPCTHTFNAHSPCTHHGLTNPSRTDTHSLYTTYSQRPHQVITQSPLTCQFLTIHSPVSLPQHRLTHSSRRTHTLPHLPCNHVPATHAHTQHATMDMQSRTRLVPTTSLHTLVKRSGTQRPLVTHSLHTRPLAVRSHSTHHALTRSPPYRLISLTNHPITGIL